MKWIIFIPMLGYPRPSGTTFGLSSFKISSAKVYKKNDTTNRMCHMKQGVCKKSARSLQS